MLGFGPDKTVNVREKPRQPARGQLRLGGRQRSAARFACAPVGGRVPPFVAPRDHWAGVPCIKQQPSAGGGHPSARPAVASDCPAEAAGSEAAIVFDYTKEW